MFTSGREHGPNAMERRLLAELAQVERRLQGRMTEIVGASNGHTPEPNTLTGLAGRVAHIESNLTYIKATVLILMPIAAVTVALAALVTR